MFGAGHRNAFTEDSASQNLKRAAPHHLVACFDDACVHWVPADERFHWYHNSCRTDHPAGDNYPDALKELRDHMDACAGNVTMDPDPETIHDGM